MEIRGFNKTTLLDYPGHLAATIFLGGCNFRCPFCHNASLVLQSYNLPTLAEKEVFDTLQKRKGILEGVCITGGEPTIYPELKDFIKKIKELGFKVKLDTNGYNPKVIEELVEQKLIDYVAMDIKNSLDKYSLSIGVEKVQKERIVESIHFLLQNKVDYEFRTTIVKEHHTMEDILEIASLLQGGKAYYLQQFKDSGDLLSNGLHSYSKESLLEFQKALLPYVSNVYIRGVE